MIVQRASNDALSSFDNLKIGDIILFKSPEPISDTGHKEVIVHRVNFTETDLQGNKIITTKGDANRFPIPGIDRPITADNYIGKVAFVIPYAGSINLAFHDLANWLHNHQEHSIMHLEGKIVSGKYTRYNPAP